MKHTGSEYGAGLSPRTRSRISLGPGASRPTRTVSTDQSGCQRPVPARAAASDAHLSYETKSAQQSENLGVAEIASARHAARYSVLAVQHNHPFQPRDRPLDRY